MTARARLHDIVLDSHRPSAIAWFWAAALDGYEIAPYDEAELARLRTIGVDDPADDPTVLVHRPDGAEPRWFFVAVPEERSVKNRMHVDLAADDVDAELARLQELGATLITSFPGHHLLADPEGNEFCLVR